MIPSSPAGREDRSPEALVQIIDSITGKLLALPEHTAVYPGHGLDTTIGEARRQYHNFASRPPPGKGWFGDVDG